MISRNISLLSSLIALIIGFMVGYFLFDNTIILPSEKEYITDTIKVPDPYPVPKPYPVPSKPKEVKVYEKDTAAIDSLKVLLSEKDILINGLKYQIIISQDYLKQFPENPKLLELDLQWDSLSIGLLNIKGIPTKETFPLYLDRYKYKWTLSGLSKTDHLMPQIKPSPYYLYSIGSGIDLWQRNIYLSGKVSYVKNRFTFYSDLRYGLLEPKKTTLNFGVEYNFKGLWPK